jgi:hypothetical protein
VPNRCLALTGALVASLAAPAPALIIDDFEEGAITVLDSDLNDLLGDVVGASQQQSGLTTTSTAGGVRLVSAIATQPGVDVDLGMILGDLGVPLPVAPPDLGGTALAQSGPLLLPAVDDGMQLTALGGAAFRIIYDGTADGAASGSAGLLDLDLSGFTYLALHAFGVTGGLSEDVPAAEVRLRLSDSILSKAGTFIPISEGVNLLPLDEFGFVDLADIQQILLDIRGIATESQLQVTLLEAVPEPGTGLLVAMGLLGLALRRRRA